MSNETNHVNAATQRSATGKKGVPTRVELSNGIRLILFENPALPMISMNIMVGFGGRYEAEEQAGLAALLGDMLDEGTERQNSDEIALSIESVGARLSTFGGYTHSGVSMVALTDDFPAILGIASDVLQRSTFPADRFAQRQARTLAQLTSREDDPRTVAGDAYRNLIYGTTHPAHRPGIGYPKTVAALTREDLIAAYRKFFIPNNIVIAVVGDFVTAKMIELVEQTFSNWQPVPDFVLPAVPEVERQREPREKLIFKDKEQLQIYVGHLGIRRANPDYYPLLVMDTILGSSPGMTSRIPRILRDEQGLAYTTYASITATAGMDPGRFTAYIGTSPANREKALTGLKAEVARIIEEPVEPEELEMAQAYLTGSFVFNFETNAQMAAFLLEAEIFNLGFDYLERYPDLIRQVTVADIARVAQTYLDATNLTTVVVGPISNKD